jgi:hypothetical protein
MSALYLIIILGLLGLSSLLGMYLLAGVLQEKMTPKILVFVYDAFVASAIALLLLKIIT